MTSKLSNENMIKCRQKNQLNKLSYITNDVNSPVINNTRVRTKSVTNSNKVKAKSHNNNPAKERGLKQPHQQLNEIGDNRESPSRRGSMNQYCVKGSEIILRQVHYIRNDTTKLLMISVDNRKYQTDTYTILFSKNVCPFNFKDNDAFVIKVIDSQNSLKSMTFQAASYLEKEEWLELYGIDVESSDKLLNYCIEEIERRRFHLGVKKRNEDRSTSKITLDILVEILESIKVNETIDFTKESQWSITGLERLIQTLLNELLEPLIPYAHQKNIRKGDKTNFSPANEARKLLNSMPNSSRIMLTSLLAHMERLSKYYLIIMSSPRKDLPHIRQNICQRLTPIVFRLQEELDNPLFISKSCEVLYSLMLVVNGISDTNSYKELKHK